MNLWLIPLFPLIGFLLNGLFGRRLSKAGGQRDRGRLGRRFVCCMCCSSFRKLYPLNHAAYTEHYFTWIQSGFLQIGFDLRRSIA